MKIDTEKLSALREETQERLEALLYLEYQLTSGKVSDDSIAFPNHLSDKILSNIVSEVSDAKIDRIMSLPILSQKLVIF